MPSRARPPLSDYERALAAVIRDEMEARGWTITYLAVQTPNVSRPQLSAVLSQKVGLHVWQLDQLCAALGMANETVERLARMRLG